MVQSASHAPQQFYGSIKDLGMMPVKTKHRNTNKSTIQPVVAVD
jgi:hypothetical protein